VSFVGWTVENPAFKEHSLIRAQALPVLTVNPVIGPRSRVGFERGALDHARSDPNAGLAERD